MISYKLKIAVFAYVFIVLNACTGKLANQGEVEDQNTKLIDNLLFIGTYTEKEAHVNGQAEGIYAYSFSSTTGKLEHKSTSIRTINPSYVVVHPSNKYLYAVNETGGDGPEISGFVSAFKIDNATGELSLINQVSSAGDWPCHISVDQSGQFVLVANYGGSVALLPLKEDGSLEEATSIIEHDGSGPTSRQTSPHAHMIIQGSNSLVYAVDLGADKVFTYQIDTTGNQLIPFEHSITLEAGSGPRHMAFHPKLQKAYVVNELSGTITAFNMESSGALDEFQSISTLPRESEEFAACAAIKIHPSGQFLYASNRGSVNNIAMFSISPEGILSLIGHQPTFGDAPRDFAIDPSGDYLIVANQNTNNVFTFRIDQETGLLIGKPTETKVPTPVCLEFVN